MSSVPKNWEPIVFDGVDYVYKTLSSGDFVLVRPADTVWDKKMPDLPHWAFKLKVENGELVVDEKSLDHHYTGTDPDPNPSFDPLYIDEKTERQKPLPRKRDHLFSDRTVMQAVMMGLIRQNPFAQQSSTVQDSDSRRRELDTARIAQMTSDPDEQRILNLLLVEGKELSADTAFRAAIVEKILGLQANTGTNAQIFEKKFVRWHEVLQKANFETTKDNLYVCSRIEKEFGQIKSVLDFKHGYNKIYTQPTNPMDPVKPPNMSHKEWDSYTWAQKSKIAQQYQNSQRPEGYTPTSSSGCLWLTVLLSTSLLATAGLAGFGIYQLTIFAFVHLQ